MYDVKYNIHFTRNVNRGLKRNPCFMKDLHSNVKSMIANNRTELDINNIYDLLHQEMQINVKSQKYTKKTGRYSQDIDVDGWNEIIDIVDRIRNKLLEESQIGEYRMNSKVKFAL